MNGAAIAGDGPLGTVGQNWTGAGLFDFNGADRFDILWQHSSGAVFTWLMNSLAVGAVNSLGGLASGWTMKR